MINNLYQSLLDSIERLRLVDESNQKAKENLESFLVYLSKNWNVISKYEKAGREIEAYIRNFNLKTSPSIDTMMKDMDVILRIDETIGSHRRLFDMFKGCRDELNQYLTESLHPEKNDLQVVLRYVETLNNADFQIAQTKKVIESIKGFSDRFGKREVEKKYFDAVKYMQDKMCFAEVEKYNSILDEVVKAVKKVSQSFENEKGELASLRHTIERDSLIWDENRKSLIKDIDGALSKGVTKSDSSVVVFRARYEEAIAIRKRDIREMLHVHGWLANRKYSAFHNELVSKRLSFSEYQSKIGEKVKERNKKIAKILGWTLGIVAVIAIIARNWQTILEVLAGLAVLALIIMFAGSKD